MAARRLIGGALVVLVSVLLFGACGGKDDGGVVGGDSSSTTTSAADTATTAADAGGPVTATILLQPATFKPENVTVKPGEAVLWKWGGGVQHDVKGEDFESKLMARGSFKHTFDTAGSYPFKCEVHPTTMKGTVTVQG